MERKFTQSIWTWRYKNIIYLILFIIREKNGFSIKFRWLVRRMPITRQMNEFSRQFDVSLIMICGALLKSTNLRCKCAQNLCSRWKANNFSAMFSALLQFHISFFSFDAVYVVVDFVFVHHYGNGRNVYICVRENQCRLNPHKHLNIHTQFFSLSRLKHLNLSSMPCVCLFYIANQKWYNLFHWKPVYIPNGKRASSFEEGNGKKSTIN